MVERIVTSSSPRVINIEPDQLIAAMYIEAVGLLEQIYYYNIKQYAPDRTETPLTLRSKITVTDKDMGVTSIPAYTAEWRVFTSTASQGTVISTEDTTQDFYLTNNGKDLVVKKNIPYTEPCTVNCTVTYDEGTMEKSVLLNTISLSEQIYPKLNIKSPNTSWFNPITMEERCIYGLAAEAHKGQNDVTESLYYVWYAKQGHSASYEPIDTIGSDGHCKFLCYEYADQNGKGQGTDTIYINAMFTEDISIMLMARRSKNEGFYPDRVYRNIKWKIPNMDIRTSCRNGDSIRDNEKVFENTVTVGDVTLTDETREANLRFDWYSFRADGTQEYKSYGTVPNLPVNAQEIGDANTNMFSEVYALGAYDKVTQDGENVTFNGELVIARERNEDL